MDKIFKPLFTPWKIGNLEIKNRIVLCPMGGTSLFGWMERHHFDKIAAQFFMERAKNNVGLLITGIAPLRNVMGGQWLYKNKCMFKKLKKYMEKFHKTGAKLFIQLTAGFGRSFSIPDGVLPLIKNKFLGVLARPIMNVSYLCASPSPLPSRWAKGVTCRAITKKEIEDLITAFGKVAKLCKDADVDGVEIHAVHEGYLLDQFTTKYTNHRTDEYGGNFENRFRFPVSIVKEIKRVCGKDYPVSLRYSVVSKTKGFCEGALPGEKFVEVGRDMIESEKAVKYLEEAGYDMLDADNGTYDAWYWAHPPTYMPENCNLEDVAHIRKFINIPVVCAGRMDPAIAANAIKEGRIDAMGVARQFLVDKAWVTKLIKGKLKDIQPCICCHNACLCLSHYEGISNGATLSETKNMATCALNPETMTGNRFKLTLAKHKKKIAVIGGGIGGMETARIATLRGHDVTIYEKSDMLGGVFIPACNIYSKEKDRELLAWYIRQVKKLKIKVKLNYEVKDLVSLGADEYIIATGSLPRNIGIDGIENSIEAIDYLNGKKVGDSIVIIGGGLTGCEIAYDLFLKGKKPTIVEVKDDLIAVKGVSLANSSFLRDFIKTNKIPVYLGAKTKKINKGSVIIETKEGKTLSLPTDSTIVSVGYVSNPLIKEIPHVHIVGDAYRVGNLKTVVWRAWEVALKL